MNSFTVIAIIIFFLIIVLLFASFLAAISSLLAEVNTREEIEDDFTDW